MVALIVIKVQLWNRRFEKTLKGCDSMAEEQEKHRIFATHMKKDYVKFVKGIPYKYSDLPGYIAWDLNKLLANIHHNEDFTREDIFNDLYDIFMKYKYFEGVHETD